MDQYTRPEEVVATYSMEQLWQMKIKQAAELINKNEIDAVSLINMLKLSRGPGIELRLLRDRFVIEHVWEDRFRAITFMGFDRKHTEKLAWLNEFRFTSLPSLIDDAKSIFPNPTLFVYKFWIKDLLSYYEETKQNGKPSNDYILERFYCYIAEPHIMLMPTALLNNQVLHYYFDLSRIVKKNENLYPVVLDFALKTLLKDESRKNKWELSLPGLFCFRCAGTVEEDGFLWLFLEAFRYL